MREHWREREREREEGNEADASATSATGLLAEPLAKTLRSLVGKQEPTHVVTGSSTFGKNLAPRLAALLDASPVTDVLEVVDEKTFVRPIYAGNALETVKFVGSGPVVVTVRATAFGSEGLETGAGEAATVEALGEEEKGAIGGVREGGRAFPTWYVPRGASMPFSSSPQKTFSTGSFERPLALAFMSTSSMHQPACPSYFSPSLLPW